MLFSGGKNWDDAAFRYLVLGCYFFSLDAFSENYGTVIGSISETRFAKRF